MTIPFQTVEDAVGRVTLDPMWHRTRRAWLDGRTIGLVFDRGEGFASVPPGKTSAEAEEWHPSERMAVRRLVEVAKGVAPCP